MILLKEFLCDLTWVALPSTSGFFCNWRQSFLVDSLRSLATLCSKVNRSVRDCDTYHDLILGLRELLLVADALQLLALLDEAGILHLKFPLLIHDLGDLLTHHLGHLLANVVLQHFQEGELVNHLNGTGG